MEKKIHKWLENFGGKQKRQRLPLKTSSWLMILAIKTSTKFGTKIEVVLFVEQIL